MEWWSVALDIRSPSTEISSTGTKSSSSTKPSSETFSLELAGSRPSPPASKTGSAAQIRSPKTAASSASKNSSTVGKQSSTAKTASSTSKSSSAADANGANSTGKTAAASKSGAAKSATTSSSANPSDGGSQDSSAAADPAVASNLTANIPSAIGVAKGRASARGTATKANDSGTPDSAVPAGTDPSADASNSSGLSLLQQLALYLEGGDSADLEAGNSAEPSTDTDTNASTDKAADGGNGAASNGAASNDANALALAMFAQAFAGALGISSAAAQGAASNSSPTASDDATGVPDATGSSGGSMQQLVSLLAQDIAAVARGKSDADASRSDVATTLGPPGDTRAANSTEGLNSLASSIAPSLAHLGGASHFSLHAQTGTNTAELKSTVGSAAWTDELGGQLTWMTQRGLESGSLRVSPEHLGPVEVKITVQNGDASVWFGASHPDTRAALEQALPRLQQMFANQGLTLTDSGVSRESPRQSRSTLPQSVAAVSAVGSSDVSVSATVRLSLGLVDTYA